MGALDETFFALLLISGGLAAVAFAAAVGSAGPRQRIVKRARLVLSRHHPVLRGTATLRLKRDTSESYLDLIVSRLLPHSDRMRQQLARTGTRLTFGKFIVITAVLALILVSVLQQIGLDPLIAWPAGLAVGVLIPRMYVKRLVRRRVMSFLAQLPDAINLMARGLRSGLPIAETVAAAAREIVGPVGVEFRRIADEAQLGRPLEEVLWQAAERVDLPEFGFMVIAFSIQRETGGNLAETLDNLAQVLLRRRQLQLKVRALTAEGRSSAWIIGLLPLVVLGILGATNRQYVSTLFTTEAGNEMLGAAALCMLLGVASLSRLCKFRA